MSERAIAILRAEADNAATNVAEALNEGRTDAEVKDLKKTCKTKVDMYNSAIEKNYYREMAAKHGANAIYEMIKVEESLIPGVIKFQYKKNDSGAYEARPVDDEIKINLTVVQSTIGKEFFHGDQWFSRVSKLARLIAVQVNKAQEGDPNFKYIIDEAVEAFELGEDANPTSKTSMTRAFQRVVDDIVFVPDKDGLNAIKFESRHWNHLREGITRNGKKNNETYVESPANTLLMVVDCINVIINQKQYVVKAG